MIGARLGKFTTLLTTLLLATSAGIADAEALREPALFSGERADLPARAEADTKARNALVAGAPIPATGEILLATATGDDRHEWFGRTVTNVGDFNNDGRDDLAVGLPLANLENDDRGNEGALRLYLGGDDILSVSLTIENDQEEEQFAWSIAALGDFNDDGFDDFAVGAPGTEVINEYPGRVFVFFGSETPDLEPDLVLEGETKGDRFGFSLAGEGDVNNDGIPDLLVGAKFAGPEETPGPGKAYLYFGGEVPAATAGLILSGSSDGDQFGDSVSIGDLDGDGAGDIAVGASRFLDSTGAVYLYRGGVALDEIEDASLVGSVTQTLFGRNVDAAGEFNGDAFMDLLVSAPTDIVDGSQSGRVYIYTSNADLELSLAAVLSAATQEAFFGFPSKWLPDINGDGRMDIGAGAPLRSVENLQEGAVEIYLGGPAFSPEAAAVFIGAATLDAFGSDFAVLAGVEEEAPRLFVGAPFADTPNPEDPEDEDEDFLEVGIGYLLPLEVDGKPAQRPLFELSARWYQPVSQPAAKAGDFDGNGKVNEDDLLLLLNFLDRQAPVAE